MIKSGNCTLYKNKEYSFFKKPDGSVNLISYEPESVSDGFEKHDLIPGAFVKKLRLGDLKTAYEIKTFAKYNGTEVNVTTEKDNLICIGTADASMAEKLGMERTDKFYYEKWVPKEDVELFELKESIK
jgi:hypothetical protein